MTPIASDAEFVGERLPAAQITGHDGQATSVRRLLSPHLTVLVLLSTDDCLVCQAETLSWRDLSRQYSALTFVPIGIGGDRAIYAEMAEQESLGVSFAYDDDYQILKGVGLPLRTPTRILLDGDRIVAVSQALAGDYLLNVARQMARAQEVSMSGS